MNWLARFGTLCVVFLSLSAGLPAQSKRKVIIDQDAAGPGGTDMQAILALVNSPDTDVLGITVLMVEHDMSLVNRVSDRVVALNYGRVVALGAPREVAAHPDVIAAYLGA